MSRLYDSNLFVKKPAFVTALYQCESTLVKQLKVKKPSPLIESAVFHFNPSSDGYQTRPSPLLDTLSTQQDPQDYFFSIPAPTLAKEQKEEPAPHDVSELELFGHTPYGIVRLGIEMLKTVAKDISSGVNAPENSSKAADHACAMDWLQGNEDCALPLSSCLELMEYGLREQGLDESLIPDMQANSQVLLEWIMNDPDEAYRYLSNYQDLFSSHHRRKQSSRDNYEQLQRDTSAYHLDDLDAEHQDKDPFKSSPLTDDDYDEQSDTYHSYSQQSFDY